MDTIKYLLIEFWEEFNWFGLVDNEIAMTTRDFLILYLGNNAIMALIIFYLASRWGAENQKRSNSAALAKNQNGAFRVDLDRRIL